MDHLTSMAVFVRVVEKGSFAAVAEEFDLSPAMVAKHIRALEERLSARLIERTTRQHHLTEIGAHYYERCQNVLAEVKSADELVDLLRNEPQGVLRVTAPVTVGAYQITPLIGRYMQRYRKVRVELSLNDRVVDLVEEGFEVAIRSGKTMADHLVAREVRAHPMVLAASPEYLSQHPVITRPEDLSQHACLGFMPWGRHPHWRFMRGDEVVDLEIDSPFTVNNGQALKVAALSHMGLILQAEVLLADVLVSGQLLKVLPDWHLPTRALYIVRRQDVRLTLKVRSFIDFLVAEMAVPV